MVPIFGPVMIWQFLNHGIQEVEVIEKSKYKWVRFRGTQRQTAPEIVNLYNPYRQTTQD